MKKFFLFLLNLGVMVLAFVFASCSGGSSSKLTNEGIFGEMPGYLLQYLDLKQKCVEELEFEDNKDKRNEIITKYIEEWNKILPSQKVQELREKPVSDSVPIISHRRVSFSKGLAGITDMEASMVGKYKVTTMNFASCWIKMILLFFQLAYSLKMAGLLLLTVSVVMIGMVLKCLMDIDVLCML